MIMKSPTLAWEGNCYNKLLSHNLKLLNIIQANNYQMFSINIETAFLVNQLFTTSPAFLSACKLCDGGPVLHSLYQNWGILWLGSLLIIIYYLLPLSTFEAGYTHPCSLINWNKLKNGKKVPQSKEDKDLVIETTLRSLWYPVKIMIFDLK